MAPIAEAGPEGWSSRDKFAAVLETSALNDADLSEYCRTRGLYPEQISAWRGACEQTNDWDKASSTKLTQATKEFEPVCVSRLTGPGDLSKVKNASVSRT